MANNIVDTGREFMMKISVEKETLLEVPKVLSKTDRVFITDTYDLSSETLIVNKNFEADRNRGVRNVSISELPKFYESRKKSKDFLI